MSSTQQLLLTEGGGAIPNYIEDVFSTYLYTGTAAALTITNNIDLSTKGGMVWLKVRSGTTGDHEVFDTLRGATNRLIPNATNAQITNANTLTAFNADGFSIGNYSEINGSGNGMASWTFRKQPKFFDVVTFTAPSSGDITINHNLGSVPGCVILKRTDASQFWVVNHRSLSNTEYLMLNATDQKISASPLSISYGTTSVTYSAGYLTPNAPYVAYFFAHDAGGFGLTGTDNVISCGSYTGNGSATGPTITLGYEPQWVMIKRTDSTGDWMMFDNMRGIVVPPSEDPYLRANLSSIESQNLLIQPLATGFSLETISANLNAASGTYIYIAIRRGPMKVPTDATKVFAPVTRTGTGATATVTGASFPPDLGLSLGRSAIREKAWHDRLRGATNQLISSFTSAEYNDTGSVTSFNMNGWSLGSDGAGNSAVNSSGVTYVNYFLGRAPSFFDEVCYTGTGANRTVTHNLGVAPELMIVKKRSAASQWYTYSSALGNTGDLWLNTTKAATYTNGYWNNTSPTSSVFSLSSDDAVNGSGITFVAYLFATCAGVSKVGSYTGNGSTQTINCGFAGGARFVLIKRTDSTGDWYVYDTARGMTTLTDPYLLLNSTAAESATLGSVTTVTTGFAVNASILAAINTNGASYIYLSIA